jgi:Raf kinase inhibitor-like YbhB/YbcL family protein
MKFFVTGLLLSFAGSMLAQQPGAPKGAPRPALTLSSTSFEDGGVIPDKYTMAAGANAVSPALKWADAPSGVVTFVLIMHDLDAAVQRKTEDYLHWMAFNIPASTTSLPEGVPANASLPDGTVQAKNSRGQVGFMGPGAPAGPFHHYVFELYGLDTKLDLGPDATRADVLKAMDGHVVAKHSITGRFHR